MERDPTQRAFTGGVIVIGIAILLLVDSVSFWPWILVVLAVATLPAGIERGGFFGGLFAALWLSSLALLIEADYLWPGILILLGAMGLVGIGNRARAG